MAEEQRLLNSLAAFHRGFRLDAAEAIAQAAGVPIGNILEMLAPLVDKSLLELVETTAEPRYRMLETIPAVCLSPIADQGEISAARKRLVRVRQAGFEAIG